MKITIQLEIEDILSSELIALCSVLVDDQPIGTTPTHKFLPAALAWIRMKIDSYGLCENDLAGWDDCDLRIMRWFAEGPEK